MIEKLPTHIVRITYSGCITDTKKGQIETKPLQRYLFIYDEAQLDERLEKAWRTDAVAEIYECKFKKTHAVAASKRKGLWE